MYIRKERRQEKQTDGQGANESAQSSAFQPSLLILIEFSTTSCFHQMVGSCKVTFSFISHLCRCCLSPNIYFQICNTAPCLYKISWPLGCSGGHTLSFFLTFYPLSSSTLTTLSLTLSLFLTNYPPWDTP